MSRNLNKMQRSEEGESQEEGTKNYKSLGGSELGLRGFIRRPV